MPGIKRKATTDRPKKRSRVRLMEIFRSKGRTRAESKGQDMQDEYYHEQLPCNCSIEDTEFVLNFPHEDLFYTNQIDLTTLNFDYEVSYPVYNNLETITITSSFGDDYILTPHISMSNIFYENYITVPYYFIENSQCRANPSFEIPSACQHPQQSYEGGIENEKFGKRGQKRRRTEVHEGGYIVEEPESDEESSQKGKK